MEIRDNTLLPQGERRPFIYAKGPTSVVQPDRQFVVRLVHQRNGPGEQNFRDDTEAAHHATLRQLFVEPVLQKEDEEETEEPFVRGFVTRHIDTGRKDDYDDDYDAQEAATTRLLNRQLFAI